MKSPIDNVIVQQMRELTEGGGGPIPAVRSTRRRRNQICIAVLAIGAINLVLYTFIYAAVGGDAFNGYRRVVQNADGSSRVEYVVRGHHLRYLSGLETHVSRGMWIYSYSHSILLLLTSGAMIISMLFLARPHILATMRDGWINGQVFVTAFGTIVALLTAAAVFLFTWDFITQLAA
ncbi:MAG: hypothetical protein U1D55_13515 [Phycisphaerae bacterium]